MDAQKIDEFTCSILRKRSAIDPAACRYALRRYAVSREKDLTRPGRYTKEMGVERQMQQAMEALLRSRALYSMRQGPQGYGADCGTMRSRNTDSARLITTCQTLSKYGKDLT